MGEECPPALTPPAPPAAAVPPSRLNRAVGERVPTAPAMKVLGDPAGDGDVFGRGGDDMAAAALRDSSVPPCGRCIEVAPKPRCVAALLSVGAGV